MTKPSKEAAETEAAKEAAAAEAAKKAEAEKAAAEKAEADKVAAERAEAEAAQAKRRAELLKDITDRAGQPEALKRLMDALVANGELELVGITHGPIGTVTLCGIEGRGADPAQAIHNWANRVRRLNLGIETDHAEGDVAPAEPV